MAATFSWLCPNVCTQMESIVKMLDSEKVYESMLLVCGAAFPTMVDLIPCLRAFTDCLASAPFPKRKCLHMAKALTSGRINPKETDQRLDLVTYYDCDTAPGHEVRTRCAQQTHKPSCTSTQCQSSTLRHFRNIKHGRDKQICSSRNQ